MDRLELAKRIARHEAPIQVPVDPEAAKRELIKLSSQKLLNASQQPPADIENLTGAEMFFAYRTGISSFGLFAHSKKFQQVIDAYGLEAERTRLAKLCVAYHHNPTPNGLTLSLRDYNLLTACGVPLSLRRFVNG